MYVLWLSVLLSGCVSEEYVPQFGDIVFQQSSSSQSRAIEIATGSRYSHCGLVVEQDGVWLVAEAVQPVKLTPLAEWIARRESGHFVAARLRDQTAFDSDEKRESVLVEAERHLNKDYDLVFAWTDTEMYCSEYVWKIYSRGVGRELCPTRQLHGLRLDSDVVRAKLRERYGEDIPYASPVVSPADLLGSHLLVEVYRD